MKESDVNNIIILICLIVEKATIFLKSFSKFDNSPPVIKVSNLTKLNNSFKENNLKYLNRVWIRKIPAVTNVDECTIAEIGVGADIAAGSQEDKGN